MAIDYTAWGFWRGVLEIIIWICVFFSNRRRVTNARFKELETRMAHMEDEVKHLPGHHDIKELSQRCEAMHGDLCELKGSLSGIRRAVDLMNDHLLNRGKRA